MVRVKSLSGREILDSRGRPTVLATCVLEGGVTASASVPSGASTGTAEAFELARWRSKRYRGLGCRRAAANIGGEIQSVMAGRSFESQAEFDHALTTIDGTANKSRLGANAVLAASVAFARAHAMERGVPLYRHFGDMMGGGVNALPRLTINLFSGGKHAGQQVSVQDVLIIPMSAQSIDESLVCAYDVYQAAADLILRKHGMRLLTADEGGLAPPCDSAEEMLALAVEAIELAGYSPGQDVALGIDVAASHFYADRRYHKDGEVLDSAGMIGAVAEWLDKYPVLSVEDGLAEDDWENWPGLRRAIAGRALTLGDDLLCTNPERIRRAIEADACDALLLKVNQIGTLTEAHGSLSPGARGRLVGHSQRSQRGNGR